MMNNYVILYNGGRMPESDLEQKQVLKAWEDWYRRVGKALVDEGNPFSPKSRSITSDGKVMDNRGDCNPSGYTIIQAESLEAAVSMAKLCPILKAGANVSVYETFYAMGK